MNQEETTMPGVAAPVRPDAAWRLLGAMTWGYVILLAVLLGAMRWLGERFWITSVMIYMPPQVWLLPLIVLFPVTFRWRPRLCLAHLGCIAFIYLVYMRYHTGPPAPRASGEITVITNNMGESHHLSLQPFAQAEDPDIIAVQGVPFSGPYYAKLYPDRYIAGQGQFILISRYPVAGNAVVSETFWHGQPTAVRFELTTPGGPMAVYNVHLPTPRGDFAKLRGKGVLREFYYWLTGRHHPVKTDYRDSMAERVELARKLDGVFAAEKLPFLAMGDFNMPDHGWIHGLISSRLTDAFAKVGSGGWGLTFPGDRHNPLTLFEPWLRIDYVFAGKGFRPVASIVEPKRRSKHRAVMARLVRQN